MPLPNTIRVSIGADGWPIGEQQREERGERGLHERRRHQQQFAGHAIGERSADRAEECDRDERGRGDRSRPRRFVRDLDDVDAERERLHPGPDVRDERAGPQPRVRGVPQRRERVEAPLDRDVG